MGRVTFLMPQDELEALDAALLALTFPPTRTAFIRACVARGLSVALATKDVPR